jgi:hypothetical protein
MRKVVHSWRSAVAVAAISGLVGWMYSLGSAGWHAAWPIVAAVFAALWALFATSGLPKASWRYRLGQNAYWFLVPAALFAQTVGLLGHSAGGRSDSRLVLVLMAAVLVRRNWHRFDPFGPLVFRLLPDPPPTHPAPPRGDGDGLGG